VHSSTDQNILMHCDTENLTECIPLLVISALSGVMSTEAMSSKGE